MRTRLTYGLCNPYMTVVRDNILDSIDYAGSGLTRAMAVAWLWRVKTWKWEGELAWAAGSEFGLSWDAGGGSFSNAQMLATGGDYFFTADSTTEHGLMHKIYIDADADATLDDADNTEIHIRLEGFRNVMQYRNSRPQPAHISQQYYPEWVITVSGFPFGGGGARSRTVEAGATTEIFGRATFVHGNGQSGDRFLRMTYVDPGGMDLNGYVECTPHEYWPYRDSAGNNPIYDSTTGALLLDPHGLT